MATPKITGKKTTGKVSAKRATAKPIGKAKIPGAVGMGKGYSTDLVDRARKGTQGIEAMLGSGNANPNGIALQEIAKKLDYIIELLTQIVEKQ